MGYVQNEREFIDDCIEQVKECIEFYDLHNFEVIVNSRHSEDFAAAGINLLRDDYDEHPGLESTYMYLESERLSKLFDGKKLLLITILPDSRYKVNTYIHGEELAKTFAEEYAGAMWIYRRLAREGLEKLSVEVKEVLIPDFDLG